jgi:metal-responsive CopG/Arc/MetJ family transcriptional regulator
MVEDKNRDLTKIWVAIPTKYLEKFDYIIDGFYLSRSEAIRHGMSYIIKDVRGYECHNHRRVRNSEEEY